MLAVVGLGGNLGDRLGTLRAAASRVAELGVVRARSTVYETAPVGGPPQPPYLNAALALDTALSPDELMRALLAIEASLGRVRAEKNGPRTIDLDLLWIDGVTLRTKDLEVPHPRLLSRAFALGPLLEVAPAAFATFPGAVVDRSALRAVEPL